MWTIADRTFSSRLVLGTGKYPSFAVMRDCHLASETAMVTLAIRRVDLSAPKGENILDFIDRERIHILPNTAGCYTAEDAILTSHLARELLGTSWIKLEVIGDPDTLFPDVEGTLEAARVLVREGFVVLPYITDDPVACKRLEPPDHPRTSYGAGHRGCGGGYRERRSAGDGDGRFGGAPEHCGGRRQGPGPDGACDAARGAGGAHGVRGGADPEEALRDRFQPDRGDHRALAGNRAPAASYNANCHPQRNGRQGTRPTFAPAPFGLKDLRGAGAFAPCGPFTAIAVAGANRLV